MARIEWVKQRLDNWARWVTQRQSGGCGYPKQAAFSRMARSAQSSDTAMIPIDDIEAGRTHAAVESLRMAHGALWLVLQCSYIGDPQAAVARRRPMATSEIAQRMGIGARGVQARLEDADAAVGLALRAAEALHGERD
jgi:hypothetical protein